MPGKLRIKNPTSRREPHDLQPQDPARVSISITALQAIRHLHIADVRDILYGPWRRIRPQTLHTGLKQQQLCAGRSAKIILMSERVTLGLKVAS